MTEPRWPRVLLVGLALLLLSACGDSSDTSGVTSGQIDESYQYGGSHGGGRATGDTDAGAAFARWVLDQDPQHRYMTDAVVRGEQALGIKVQPQITRAELQQLLTSVTEGMARTFPGRDLVVTAFYQSGDRLAESRFNATSGRVDVRFV